MCSVQYVVCGVQCAVCSVMCAVCSVPFTVYSMQCTVCSAQLQCACSVQFSGQCSNKQCALPAVSLVNISLEL